MQRTKRIAVIGALAGVSVSFGSAQAAVVSLNLDVFGTIGTVGTDFRSGAGDIAGVVPVGNWTGTWNGSFAQFGHGDMIDSDGNLTTIDMNVVGFNDFSIQGSQMAQDADGTWNRALLNGYSNAGAAVDPPVSTVTIDEISYSSYDIYVYFGSDDASRSGTVTDGTTTYSFNVLDDMVAGPNAVFQQTTDTGAGNPEANYAVFSGLSGAMQTITVNIPDFGGVSGVQIVDTGPSILEGDYDGSGFVSQGDLDLVLLNWGDSVAPAGFNEAAIPGGGPFDGLMSQNELDGVLLNWGDGTPPSLTTVPEPASLATLGVGLCLLFRGKSRGGR